MQIAYNDSRDSQKAHVEVIWVVHLSTRHPSFLLNLNCGENPQHELLRWIGPYDQRGPLGGGGGLCSLCGAETLYSKVHPERHRA